MAATPEEHKDWKDGFVFVGNQIALDFLNTKPFLGDGPKELLPDTDALERWLNASGLLASSKARALVRRWIGTPDAKKFLDELVAFRERLRVTVTRIEEGHAIGDAFLCEINTLLEKHPMCSLLRRNKQGVERVTVFEPQRPEDVWAPFAAATAELLSDIPSARIRKCESCVLHFYDTSKKGSRRWCSMNICGNRIKVAAYQQRNRTARSGV